MMVFTILASTLVLTVSWLYFLKKYGEGKYGETNIIDVLLGFSIVGWVISTFTLIMLLLVYTCHATNLGTVRQGYSVVKVQQDRLKRLRNDLVLVNDSIKQGNVALVNHDSPVKSLIDQIALAETSVAEAQLKIANAEVSISQRKAGPGYFIVSWFGDK